MDRISWCFYRVGFGSSIGNVTQPAGSKPKTCTVLYIPVGKKQVVLEPAGATRGCWRALVTTIT